MRAATGYMLLALLAFGSVVARAADTAIPDLPGKARELMYIARDNNQAHEIVRSLTTEVGPRLAGTAAEERARHWAVEKMQALGLEAVRVEPFDMPLWLRGVEQAEIVTPFPQQLTVTALGGSASTGPLGVTAAVVAFDSLAALKAAAQDSVAGRIVFIDEPMARSRDGADYGAAVQKRIHAANAARERGAAAVLIRSVGTSSHRFAHTGLMRPADAGGTPGVPAAALAAPDADQLRRTLAYGKPVTVKLVLTPQTRPGAVSGNVIGEIRGREVPQEIVLVGAHLDSWDLGTGAVDDGAGVAIVLAALKVLRDHLPDGPRRTLRVVLFGAEEVGTIGASAYVKAHEGELSEHILAAESDFGAGAIWRFDTAVGGDKLVHTTAIAGLLEELGIERGGNEARGGPDVRSLHKAGVPVVSLVQDGGDYFDLHHTANDTLDKIDASALHQNVAAYTALLFIAAESGDDFR